MAIADKEPTKVWVRVDRRARQIMRATGTGEKKHGGLDEIKREFGNGANHELSSKPGAAIKRSARVKRMHLPEESIRAMQRTLTLWQCGQRIGGAGGVAG